MVWGQSAFSSNMLCFSVAVDMFRFLIYLGSGNVVYIMILDSSKSTNGKKGKI